MLMMRSQTINLIVLFAVIFLMSKVDAGVDSNGACNCSRQTSGKCAVTKQFCFAGSKHISFFCTGDLISLRPNFTVSIHQSTLNLVEGLVDT